MTIPFQRILIIPTIPFPVTSLPYSFIPYSVPYCDPTHTPQTFHLKHFQINPLFSIPTPRFTPYITLGTTILQKFSFLSLLTVTLCSIPLSPLLKHYSLLSIYAQTLASHLL